MGADHFSAGWKYTALLGDVYRVTDVGECIHREITARDYVAGADVDTAWISRRTHEYGRAAGLPILSVRRVA